MIYHDLLIGISIEFEGTKALLGKLPPGSIVEGYNKSLELYLSDEYPAILSYVSLENTVLEKLTTCTTAFIFNKKDNSLEIYSGESEKRDKNINNNYRDLEFKLNSSISYFSILVAKIPISRLPEKLSKDPEDYLFHKTPIRLFIKTLEENLKTNSISFIKE